MQRSIYGLLEILQEILNFTWNPSEDFEINLALYFEQRDGGTTHKFHLYDAPSKQDSSVILANKMM